MGKASISLLGFVLLGLAFGQPAGEGGVELLKPKGGQAPASKGGIEDPLTEVIEDSFMESSLRIDQLGDKVALFDPTGFDSVKPLRDSVKESRELAQGARSAQIPAKFSSEKEIRLNQLYSVGGQKMRFEVLDELDYSDFFMFRVTGKGRMGLRFFQSPEEKAPFVSTVIELEGHDDVTYIPVSYGSFGYKHFVYEVWNAGRVSEKSFTFSLGLENKISLEFDERVKVMSRFASFLTFEVTMPSDRYLDGGDYRLQFILQTSLGQQRLTGGERLSMFLNRGAKSPTEKFHDMAASGSSGTGLVKTLKKTSKFFCTGKNCVFTALVTVEEINHVLFMPTVLSQGQKLPFKKFVYLLEEVESGEEVAYVFEGPEEPADWSFALQPIEGLAEVFIHPDLDSLPPQKDSNSDSESSPFLHESTRLFHLDGRRPENFVLSQHQGGSLGISMRRFLVVFKSTDPKLPAVLKFEVARNPPDTPRFIKKGAVESGLALAGETLDFKLNLRSVAEQIFHLNVTLESEPHRMKLAVKKCKTDEILCDPETDEQETSSSSKDAIASSESSDKKGVSSFSTSSADRITSSTPPYFSSASLNFTCKGPSDSCSFGVSINSPLEAEGSKVSRFRLETRGQEPLTPLIFGESQHLSLGRGESATFIFDLRSLDSSHPINSVFRLIALTGRFVLYFSTTTPYPTPSNSELTLEITEESFSSFHSAELQGSIPLFSSKPSSHLYIFAQSSEYSLFDLSGWVDSGLGHPSIEPIPLNRALRRKMNKSDLSASNKNQKMHAKFFALKLPRFVEPQLSSAFSVHLTSDVRRLKMCGRIEAIEPDVDAPCNFLSETETMELPINDLFGSSITIMVSRDFEGERPDLEEFDFVITASSPSASGIVRLSSPGLSYVLATRERNEPLRLELDLFSMSRSALISLTSDDALLFARVFARRGSNRQKLGELDKFSFAFNITNAEEFRERYCEEKCVLELEVLTTAEKPSRFTVAFTIDDVPITLKEGGWVVLPASQKLYLLHRPAKGGQPVFFAHLSDQTELVAFGAVLETKKLDPKTLVAGLSEQEYAFKTSPDRSGELVIPRLFLEGSTPRVVAFFLVPQFDLQPPLKETSGLLFFAPSDRNRVELHSSVAGLEPFRHKLATVEGGNFAHFHFSLDRPKGFSVSLSVVSGEADLFINPGLYNMTTSHHYWKKSDGYRSDKLRIPLEELIDTEEPLGFSIGVFGRESSRFSLMVIPDFKNMISVPFQHLLELDLPAEEDHYFDLLGRKEGVSSLLFTEQADVEVSLLPFDDKAMLTDFLYLLEDESNYRKRFVVRKGDPPLRGAAAGGGRMIARLKARRASTRLNFLLFDPKKPILVFAERRFVFVQEKDEETFFKADLMGDCEAVDVDVKLAHGSIEFRLGVSPESLEPPLAMRSPGQRFSQFRLGGQQLATNHFFFRSIFVAVRAEESSKFSILIRPLGKFQEIREFEPEIIRPSESKPQFLFHYISPTDAQSTMTLSIFLEYPSSIPPSFRPQLLFSEPTSSLLDQTSVMIPMPLIELSQQSQGDFLALEAKPSIKPGYFLIKIPAYHESLPIKISLSSNGHRQIDPNGLYPRKAPSKGLSHSYSVYIPEAGELRLLLETCGGVELRSGVLSTPEAFSRVKFDKDFSEVLTFLDIDHTSPRNHSSSFKVLMVPMKRVQVLEKSLLAFKIVRKRKGRGQDYSLVSEFKPGHLLSFLKDYLQLFGEKSEDPSHNLQYDFADSGTSLRLAVAAPRIATQLLIDHPEVSGVEVRVSADLFSDFPEFENRLAHCNLSLLRRLNAARTSASAVLDRKSIEKNEKIDDFQLRFSPSSLTHLAYSPKLRLFVSVGIRALHATSSEPYCLKNCLFAEVPYMSASLENKLSKPFISYSGRLVFWILVSALATLLAAAGLWYRAKTRSTPPENKDPNPLANHRNSVEMFGLRERASGYNGDDRRGIGDL